MRTRVFGKPLGIAALIVVAYAGLIASASADTKVPAAVAEAATAAPRVKSPVKATVGKPVAPIAIDYELSAEPALGVPFDMRITASSMGITDLTWEAFAPVVQLNSDSLKEQLASACS